MTTWGKSQKLSEWERDYEDRFRQAQAIARTIQEDKRERQTTLLQQIVGNACVFYLALGLLAITICALMRWDGATVFFGVLLVLDLILSPWSFCRQ